MYEELVLNIIIAGSVCFQMDGYTERTIINLEYLGCVNAQKMLKYVKNASPWCKFYQTSNFLATERDESCKVLCDNRSKSAERWGRMKKNGETHRVVRRIVPVDIENPRNFQMEI